MNLFSKLLCTSALVLFSAASQAQNYYVCDTGNDANNGKSESSPFKSFAKAINTFNNMFAGDNVLFCRGGSFQVTDQRIFNTRCGPSSPCTLADYGDPDKSRPQLIVNEKLTGLNFQNGSASVQDGGYIIRNLILQGLEARNGVFLYNDVDDVVLDNLHIEGFQHGVYSGGSSWELESGSNGLNDRIVLANSTIINNSWQGWLGACNDCIIENNYFENNGFYRHIKYHNIYMSSAGKDDHFFSNVTIRGNTLYKSAIVDGQCKGVSLVVHGKYRNLTIENNTVKEDVGKVSPYCWGISVDPGYAKEEAFYNIKINNNRLINIGNVAIGCASCEGVEIIGNEIVDEGNVLRVGIKVPVREEDQVKSKDITISQNKIILSHINSNGISIGGDHDAVITSNETIQPNGSSADCIERWGINSLIKITSNLCKSHNGISLNDLTDEEVDDQQEPTDELPPESEPEVVENIPKPVDEQIESSVEEPLNDSPLEIVLEETESPDPTPKAPTDFVNSDNEEQSELIQRISSTGIITTNGSEKSLDTQMDETSTLNSSKKLKTASGGGGSSSSTSSKSKTSLASESIIVDDVISYTNSTGSDEPTTNIMSVDVDSMEVTSGLPQTDTESSKYSVKVKDVVEASRQDNSDIDVTQCRAYASGRCLMK